MGIPWWSWLLIYLGIGALLALVAQVRARRIIKARKQAASQAPRWGFEKDDLQKAQGCLTLGLLVAWPVTAPLFFKKPPPDGSDPLRGHDS